MLVATVEHTGTHRLLSFLRGEPWPVECDDKPEGRYWFAHLYDVRMPRILELAATNEVLTTARDRAAVTASWVARGRDLADLDRQWTNYTRLLELQPYIFSMGRTWSRKPITF